MNIETKYGIGDRVWHVGIRSVAEYEAIDCLTCDNTGEVEILGDKFGCPKCHGEKCTIKKRYKKYIVLGGNTITRIVTFVDANKNEIQINNSYHINLKKDEWKTINETELYPSVDIAKVMCDKMNDKCDIKSSEYFLNNEEYSRNYWRYDNADTDVEEIGKIARVYSNGSEVPF